MNMNTMALPAVKYRFDNFAECGDLYFREAFMRTFCWRLSKPMKLISCALPSVRYAIHKKSSKKSMARTLYRSCRSPLQFTSRCKGADTLTDCRALAQTARTTFRSPLSPRWKSLSCETDRLQVPNSTLGILNLTLDPANLFG